MPQTTRTLNPLPFGDLEPHRFEDLVRGLVYDYRPWQSIEAVGRLGADEGIDIRATERVATPWEPPVDGGPGGEPALDGEPEAAPAAGERTWIIQCKRERTIGPAAARQLVRESLREGTPPPHGFLVAAACDFSLKTRQALREEILAAGVQEFDVWGKAELEDRLFLPKNDHLLFAFFGISLQTRRRSLRTEVRARLATKRALITALGGDVYKTGGEPVLLRDPRVQEYPFSTQVPGFLEHPAWRYYEFAGHTQPDFVAFVTKRHFAFLDEATGEWDAMDELDLALPRDPQVWGLGDRPEERWAAEDSVRREYEASVPREQRAFFEVHGLIHYDQVLAVDAAGDVVHPGPHLLVELTPRGYFFDRRTESLGRYQGQVTAWAHPAKRIVRFPRPTRPAVEEGDVG